MSVKLNLIAYGKKAATHRNISHVSMFQSTRVNILKRNYSKSKEKVLKQAKEFDTIVTLIRA